jgi:hypothetical protein
VTITGYDPNRACASCGDPAAAMVQFGPDPRPVPSCGRKRCLVSLRAMMLEPAPV